MIPCDKCNSAACVIVGTCESIEPEKFMAAVEHYLRAVPCMKAAFDQMKMPDKGKAEQAS